MKFIQKTIVIFLLSLSAASAQENTPFRALQDMFAGLSAYDSDAMASFGTDDFHLLENGVVWSMDDLVDAVKANEGTRARRNYFSVIRQRENNGVHWISYWNRADFLTTEDEEFSITWLESAVIIMVDGQWKVQMAHSTRVNEPKTIPDGVIMEEYVGEGAFRIMD